MMGQRRFRIYLEYYNGGDLKDRLGMPVPELDSASQWAYMGSVSLAY
jgi:hypothetical protein